MMTANLDEEQYYAFCESITRATVEESKPVWEIVRGIKKDNPTLANQLENGVMDLLIATMEKSFTAGFEFATTPLCASI